MDTLKNGALEKAFKNIVKGVKARPVLQCLHFSADGSIVATDSHRLLQIRDFHNLDTDFNFDLLAFKSIDGDYPETDRIIVKNSDYEVFIRNTDLAALYPLLKGLSKVQSVDLTFREDQLTVSTDNLETSTPIKAENIAGVYTVNPKYLLHMVEFYKDYQSPEIDIKVMLRGPLAPFAFCADKAIYMLTPMRKY